MSMIHLNLEITPDVGGRLQACFRVAQLAGTPLTLKQFAALLLSMGVSEFEQSSPTMREAFSHRETVAGHLPKPARIIAVQGEPTEDEWFEHRWVQAYGFPPGQCDDCEFPMARHTDFTNFSAGAAGGGGDG